MIARFIFAGLFSALLAGSLNAQGLTLQEISAYLNSIRTAKARFVQINDDGSRSVGELMILRPGRMRFDYDAPDDSLVIAGQGLVAIFDARSNEPPQKFQLANTPLKLILASDIDLTREKMVVGHGFDGAETIVTAQDPKHPDYGAIRIHFAPGPSLSRWTVIDGSGAQTTVALEGLETGMRIPARLFDTGAALEELGFD